LLTRLHRHSDIYRVDEVLARVFNMLFVNLSRSGFTLVIVSVSTPAFVAFILPLMGMYIWIQRYYLRTSRELKRLDSVSKSPIYAHFQESLGGISTIRAYGQQPRFERENEWRSDANLRAYFPSISANRWLAVRLEFIGAIVIFAAAGFAIISVAGGSGLSSGWVGLSISYALQITTSLNWIVRQSVEVETNIVSVERVLEYARLPSEAPEIIRRNRPPANWPAKGAVEFKNYSARYREGLDLVLKNVNLDVKSHEKIGIVGRTGAGKSSLTLALFRIIEPDTGNISIDNYNTSAIGLLDLRRRLAIIPQDAALFEGTIRDNLDPGNVHDDTELWTALGTCNATNHPPLSAACPERVWSGAPPSERVRANGGRQNTPASGITSRAWTAGWRPRSTKEVSRAELTRSLYVGLHTGPGRRRRLSSSPSTRRRVAAVSAATRSGCAQNVADTRRRCLEGGVDGGMTSATLLPVPLAHPVAATSLPPRRAPYRTR